MEVGGRRHARSARRPPALGGTSTRSSMGWLSAGTSTHWPSGGFARAICVAVAGSGVARRTSRNRSSASASGRYSAKSAPTLLPRSDKG